jgi:hypothetical protein
MAVQEKMDEAAVEEFDHLSVEAAAEKSDWTIDRWGFPVVVKKIHHSLLNSDCPQFQIAACVFVLCCRRKHGQGLPFFGKPQVCLR